MGKYSGIGISGSGSYAPKNVMYTDHVKSIFNFTEAYIQKIGISKVHIADETEYPTDMAIQASKDAIKDAGILPEDINIIIYSYGGFPEYFMWAEYAKIQYEIGAINASAMRFDQACNAQIIALDYAVSKIKADENINHILIVSADMFKEPIVNRWKTADACIWGDGASAAIISRGVTDHEIIDVVNMTDGALNHLWRIPVGGTVTPLEPEHIEQNLFRIDMNRFALEYLKDDAERERVSKRIVNTNIKTFEKLLEKIKKEKSDVNKIITYNVGKFIIENISKMLCVNLADTSWEYGSQHGHMGPADIFFNYDQMKKNNKIKSGDLVVLFSAGTGFSTASAAIQF
ncbi:3-oxoacyl-ACP synthase III family protein [Fusibacter sp. 3D3]|uniref:3-oxoacyl-ACP synthase III family protein n=1 Tax=Fusibacter sp. 3D3 TaxID=1048380 RepID=UPI000852C8C9|nr:3-oxoacyl-[acyl-carrier-protein] synthase III C-terminal domain-containing protein [Fusibacter sp. 3D3]GAU79282.1 3-oxoacyl-[acyl-carrier-protein] synthase KASIII [Fusibacter sp. 3D3]